MHGSENVNFGFDIYSPGETTSCTGRFASTATYVKTSTVSPKKKSVGV
jgi:hypothetical protein